MKYLRTGLLEEMHDAIAPILFGGGERLFDDIDGGERRHECVELVSSSRPPPIKRLRALPVTVRGAGVGPDRIARPTSRARIVGLQAVAALVVLLPSCSAQTDDLDLLPRLSLARVLEIRGEDASGMLFSDIGGIAAGADASIYVAELDEPVILHFGASGELIRRIGRSGEGPGEFRSIGWLEVRKDTLLVIDPELGRLSRFSTRGELIGTRTWWVPAPAAGFFTTAPLALFPSGQALVRPAFAADLVAGSGGVPVPLLAVDSTGAVTDTIVLLDYRSLQLTIAAGAGPFFTGNPFNDSPLFGISALDDAVVVVDRSVGGRPPGGFAVTRLSRRGDTLRHRSYAAGAMPVAAQARDSLANALWHRLGGDAGPVALAAVRSALPRQRYRTPVSSLFVGQDGRVWLAATHASPGERRWWVIGADGAPLGQAVLPERFVPGYADGDSIWGVEYDELDVPALVRYRVGAAHGALDDGSVL